MVLQEQPGEPGGLGAERFLLGAGQLDYLPLTARVEQVITLFKGLDSIAFDERAALGRVVCAVDGEEFISNFTREMRQMARDSAGKQGGVAGRDEARVVEEGIERVEESGEFLTWIVSPQKVLENLQWNAFQNNRTNIRGY